MLKQQVYILNTFLLILDALCIVAAGYSAYFIKKYSSIDPWSMDFNVFTASVLFVMFVNNYIMGKVNLYSDRMPSSYFRLLWAIFRAIVADFAILSSGIFFFKQIYYSRAFLLIFAVLSFTYIVLGRILFQFYTHYIFKNNFNLHKIIIVANSERGQIVSNLMKKQVSWGHKIVGRLSIQEQEDDPNDTPLGTIEDLPDILRNQTIDEVVFALNEYEDIDLSANIDICNKMGVAIRFLPALWKPGKQTISVEICQNIPFLTLSMDNFNASGLLYKRVLDIIGGTIGILILCIIYPFIAVAIKLDSKGPVLFKQKRMGKNRRIFNLYKFRSMYQDAEQKKIELMGNNEMQGAMFKLTDDPRITRVGRWLRKTSLDEFPQFINVIKGEMSLVGTRPPTLDEVEKYQISHLKRISGKPGITGLWQVSGRNKISDFSEVVELDCKYLDNWRFFDDLIILAKTIFIVLLRKGAV